MRSGVYLIKNTANEKCYVGSAVNLRERRLSHFRALRRNAHANCYLQRAWNKYGEPRFIFTTLLLCAKEHLLFFEQRTLDIFKAEGSAIYNIRPKAESNLGIKARPETRLKISIAGKGRRHPPEVKAKISAGNKGKVKWPKGKRHSNSSIAKMKEKWLLRSPPSDETRRKMSEVAKRRTFSAETRAKFSANQTARNLGRKLTEETKRKIGLSSKGRNIGRKHTATELAKMSLANKIRLANPEVRRRMSEQRKGVPFSETHRANIIKAQRARRLKERIARATGLDVADI